MNYKKLGKFVGIGLVIIIIAAVLGFGIAFYDVVGYNAKESTTLNPDGAVVGNAMVVYDPGITGTAKNVADSIAKDLQAKGYSVELAGISSLKADNTTGYSVIVVGGPIYAGNASSSVKAYLKNLKISNNTNLGVFATGQDPDTAKNTVLLLNEAAPLPENSDLQIKAVMKVVNGNIDNNTINNFVNTLIK
jgi:menaquinone-dependent protoporphyrinogen IX oxidase